MGERADDFTALLREFTGHDLFRDQPTRMDASGRVMLWCAARGWPVSEGSPIYHDDQQLTRPVSIVLATAPGPSPQAVAIVVIDDAEPVVYPDITTDEGYWYAVATVNIICPAGHRLTWDGARTLIDHEGKDTTILTAFGTGPHAPFRSCRTCQAYDNANTDEHCGCGGWAIHCAACGERCSLALPDIPTHQ